MTTRTYRLFTPFSQVSDSGAGPCAPSLLGLIHTLLKDQEERRHFFQVGVVSGCVTEIFSSRLLINVTCSILGRFPSDIWRQVLWRHPDVCGDIPLAAWEVTSCPKSQTGNLHCAVKTIRTFIFWEMWLLALFPRDTNDARATRCEHCACRQHLAERSDCSFNELSILKIC